MNKNRKTKKSNKVNWTAMSPKQRIAFLEKSFNNISPDSKEVTECSSAKA